jgi:hypothetical protein
MCVLPIVAATLLGFPYMADAQSTEPLTFSVHANPEQRRAPGSSLNDHILTFNVPVQVPHVILPPGTYIFRPISQGVIQVLGSNGSRVCATFFTFPATKDGLTSMGEVTFQRIADDMPIRLIAWYPWIGTGFQPVYPKSDKLSICGQPESRPR